MKRYTLSSFFATVLGIGFIPFAPGTFGTLAAVGLYLILPAEFFLLSNLLYYLFALIVFSLFSVFISSKAEQHLGHDAPAIVIDEVCGYFFTVILMPKSLSVALYAFVLFRVFDIAKPFPIKQSQVLPRGWGIVIDDILAGVFATLILHLLWKFIPGIFF